MSALRVVFVDHTAVEGGGEIAMERLTACLRENGDDVRVLLLADGPLVARLRKARIPIRVLDADEGLVNTSRHQALNPRNLVRSAVHTLGIVPRVVRSVRAADAELVVANTLKAAIITAIAAPLARRRWVWHLHDRLAADYMPRPLVMIMRGLTVIGPKRIVTNSHAVTATLPRAAQKKTVVAPPGLAFSEHPAPHERGTTVGIIGRISPTKGQREFISAASLIASEFPEVNFRVIGAPLFGETDYEEALHAQVADLGLGERVTFTGWSDDIGAELRGLSVLIHASPVPEPFGQVIVEGMDAAVPVIAARAGGATEIVAPGATEVAPIDAPAWSVEQFGLLSRPGDAAALAQALRWVLTHGDEARAIAASAREHAHSTYSISRTADLARGAWSDALAE